MKNVFPLVVGTALMVLLSMGVGNNLMVALSLAAFAISFCVFVANLLAADVDHTDWHLTPHVLVLLGYARYRRRINSDFDSRSFAYEYSDKKLV